MARPANVGSPVHGHGFDNLVLLDHILACEGKMNGGRGAAIQDVPYTPYPQQRSEAKDEASIPVADGASARLEMHNMMDYNPWMIKGNHAPRDCHEVNESRL